MTTRVHGEAASYTLVIGASGNTIVGLLRNGAATPITSETYLVSKTVSGVLSSSISRTYWLSWQDRTIEFGRGGLVAHETMISYREDGLSQITKITGYNAGKGDLAWFRFMETEGEKFHQYDVIS